MSKKSKTNTFVDYSEGFIDLPKYMKLAETDKRDWLGLAKPAKAPQDKEASEATAKA